MKVCVKMGVFLASSAQLVNTIVHKYMCVRLLSAIRNMATAHPAALMVITIILVSAVCAPTLTGVSNVTAAHTVLNAYQERMVIHASPNV